MADPTLVNGQITDGVAQANVKVLGDAPAMALATSYQTLGASAGTAVQNATANQQQFYAIGSSVAAQAVSLILSVDTAAAARATTSLLSDNAFARSLAELNAVTSQKGSGG